MNVGARTSCWASGGGGWVNPYVTDGLVAMWDGLQGLNATTDTWLDVVSGTELIKGALEYGDGYAEVPSDSTYAQANWTAALIEGLYDEDITVESCLANHGFSLSWSWRNVLIVQDVENWKQQGIVRFAYNHYTGVSLIDLDKTTQEWKLNLSKDYASDVSNPPYISTSSWSVSPVSNCSIRGYVNGVIKASKDSSIGADNRPHHIRLLKTPYRLMNIRVYNRILTDSERASMAAIDYERYAALA